MKIPDRSGHLATRVESRRSVLYPLPAVREVIHTTNAIESVSACLRRIIKFQRHFTTDEAATKRIWLSLCTVPSQWGVTPMTGKW